MFLTNCLTIRTDVTCVKFINNEIFAGIGGYLHIFNKTSGNLIKAVHVFDGQKIYNVVPDSSSTQFLIYGGKLVKLFRVDDSYTFNELLSCTCNDWILDAKWVNHDSEIVTIFMHNIVVRWTNCMNFIARVVCEEKCILYSARIVNDFWDDLIVLSGTVFGQIVIWWPAKCPEYDFLAPVLCRLVGHHGSIFSIDYNSNVGLICSTSDDRSVRLWSIASKNLLLELSQENVDIRLKCSLFNHTARVFQCKVSNNFVISGGEDSLINIWDLDGNLVRKIDVHQNACLWSLDCDDNFIVVGTGNYAVTVFPLKHDVKRVEFESYEVPKRFVILENFDLVSVSEKGLLEYHSSKDSSRTEIARHADLSSYSILEVSSCRKLVALAGFHGTIHIYEQRAQNLQNLCSYTLKDRARIFSFHWLSKTRYLTCGPNGVLNVWNLKEGCVIFVATLNLPHSKERWTTSACELNGQNIVVADRKGNVYLYLLTNKDPIQILRKAHNYLGVTCLHFKNKELTSLGRNSIVKKYHFDESHQLLSVVSSDKLPFTWLAEIHKSDNHNFILAFLSKDFLIWDYKSRRTLLQFDCGGGHRSWDFYKQNNRIVFAYIKDKRVITLKFDWAALYPLDVVNGHHVAEINSVSCFHFLSDANQTLIISGGEDTTLRLSQFCHTKNTFNNLCTLKSHLSSIRAVTSCKVTDDNKNSSVENFLVVSAGGRAQIVSWNLSVNLNGNLTATCSEKFSYYEQLETNESETRIMDLCLISLKNYILLIAACSDGLLKVFLILLDNFKIILIGSVFYKLKCILKVAHLEVQKVHLIVSMATDGKMVFWDFTQVIDELNNEKCDFNNYKSELNLEPIHCIDTHQSGINAFIYKRLNENKILFLSGGDDNAIFFNLLEFKYNDERLNIDVLSTFSNSSSHCSQITGVFLTSSYFLTTSIDQKVNIFSWNVNNTDQLCCDFIQKYNSSVADIQGMQCCEYQDDIFIYLYGVGIEFVKLQKKKINLLTM